MTEFFRKTMVDGDGGAHIQLRSAVPDGRIRAVVQINHGMAEHSERYRRFARKLVGAGYAVYAHDHRGHGHTTAPRTPQGCFGPGGFDAVIGDVLRINDHVNALHDGVPVVVFGHSMGSIIGLNFALRHPDRVAALACWNAGVEAGLLAKASRVILGAEAMIRGRNRPSRIAPRLTFDAWNKVFKPNRTAFDWLSRDIAEVDAYVADPLCGFDCSSGLWLDLLAGVRFGADDRNLSVLPKDLPIHVMGGAKIPAPRAGGIWRIWQSGCAPRICAMSPR